MSDSYHFDFSQRRIEGATVANALALAGIAALTPVDADPSSTTKAITYPSLTHLSVTPHSITALQASALGAELAKVSHYTGPAPAPWDHFAYAQQVIESSVFPNDTRERARRVVGIVRHDTHTLYSGPQSFAHGDLQLYNVLFLEDGTLTIVNWDYAGAAPTGWDLAYLRTHLTLTERNPERFGDLLKAYQANDGVVPDDIQTLCLVNAMLDVSFTMTKPLTNERVEQVERQLSALEAWALSGVEPLWPD